MNAYVISLDIGGTFIKYGIVDSQGKILYKTKRPTIGENTGKSAVVESASAAVEELIAMYPLSSAVCISTSGEYNRKTGIMMNATGVFIDLIGFNYKKYFEDKFGKTTIGENDAKCAALAEKWQGAGRGTDEFLMVTVGTGIGGAIFSKGQLMKGLGAGGEIGHFRMMYNGLPCSCGGKGCFERYASMKALITQVKESTGNVMTGEEILKRYMLKETDIVPVIKQWLAYLVDGISSLLHILNPEYVIIGGGISENSYIIKEIDEAVRANAMASYIKNLKILPAETGNNAGMLGAAWLYFENNT